MIRRFRGGVHVHAGKERTKGFAIVDFGAPARVVIPLQQHAGAPARAVVAAGDVVRKGQLIGQAAGFISATVHASIGGAVTKIAAWPHPLGVPVESVVVEGNGDESWAAGCNVERDVSALDPAGLREAILSGGVVGLGGAMFPTHVKLSPVETRPIDTLIINGAECEPLLTGDERLMIEGPERIFRGAQLMLRALGCKRCIIGIEKDKREALAAMRKAVIAQTGFSVAKLRTRYPQGGEKQLIYALLKREVPSGGLPIDIGVVVHNVATCRAADEAVRYSRPLIDRVVTVTGDRAETAGNYRIRIGTLISDVLARVGAKDGLNKIIVGGPMMGLAQPSAEIPVIKGVGGIVFTREKPPKPWLACIRCGRCVDACPVGLTPSQLSVLLESDKFDGASEWNINDCIECGCCAYVCPSRRPIVQQVKYGKAELRRLRTAT